MMDGVMPSFGAAESASPNDAPRQGSGKGPTARQQASQTGPERGESSTAAHEAHAGGVLTEWLAHYDDPVAPGQPQHHLDEIPTSRMPPARPEPPRDPAAELVLKVQELTAALNARGAEAAAQHVLEQRVGDARGHPLQREPGELHLLERGVVDRQAGMCLLCHRGPFPEERFQGDLAPNLAGAGARWTVPQLRLRIADSSRLNPATIMPSYYRTEGLTRVAPAHAG